MDIAEIDVDELARLRGEGDITLIDVRQPDEYEEARVPGTVLIPLAEVPDRVDEVPADGTVYVICARGARSLKAAEFLTGQGRQTVNVAGGTLAWIAAGHDTESG
jgi:rhodanese-related sulfurtransferase